MTTNETAMREEFEKIFGKDMSHRGITGVLAHEAAFEGWKAALFTLPTLTERELCDMVAKDMATCARGASPRSYEKHAEMVTASIIARLPHIQTKEQK